MINKQTYDQNILLLFNKISIKTNYWNLNYLLFNNFNLNFFNLNFFLKNCLFINYKIINFKTFKNFKFNFKNFNNFRKYLFVNKIFNFSFKNTKFFNFSFLNKNKLKNKHKSIFYSFYRKKIILPFFFYNYKYNFFKNWIFLIGSLISPYSPDLNPRRIWIRKSLIFNFLNNRLYFNLVSKKKILNSKIKFKSLKNFKITLKKFLLNNYFYITYTKDNKFLKYILKLNTDSFSNNLLLKKKNYDWFLSRPYLFLNFTKFVKLNKNYANSHTFLIFKKYIKFFNTIKRLNFYFKFKKTTDIFFRKIFYNPDLINKNFKNKINSKFLFFKNKFSLYINSDTFFLKKKKKYFIKNIKYFTIFYLMIRSKILKKNKFFFNIKFFSNIKLKFVKFSKRNKKINIFLKSFYFFKKIKYQMRGLIKNNRIIFKFLNKTFNYNKNPFFLNFFKKSNFLIFFFKIKSNFKLFFNKKFNIQLKNTFLFITNFDKNFYFSYIFSKIKKPIFVTKLKNNFLLNQYGFFFINNSFFNNRNILNQSYNLKKLMYSFSYKNEIQRIILKRYSKTLHLSNYFFKNINDNVNDFFLSKNLKNSNNFLDKIFHKDSNMSFLLNKRLAISPTWVYFRNQILSAKNNYNDNAEFNIKRVKFKPGYMNLWRDAREVIKTSLFLKIKYQYKLTNYLSKYNKFLYFKNSISFEMQLLNIILKSRLFTDWTISSIFIEYNNFYVNGLICNNPYYQLFVGDFIQMIVSYKYYIISKWFLNLNLKKKNKLKKTLHKKIVYSSSSDEKKKSFNLPKWILFNKNLTEDVSNFIELDYFTLSIFILYEPFIWSDINIYNIVDQKFNIINLYNWKYIT